MKVSNELILHKIVHEFGDDYTRSGDELLYHCPFCPSLGKRNDDRKLYVNSVNGKYHCFRCESKGSLIRSDSEDYSLYTELGDPIDLIQKYLNNDDKQEDSDYYWIPSQQVIDYPNSVFYNYLIDRGITPDDMRFYQIRGFGYDNPHFVNRVIIPNKIVMKNWTDMYTCRSIFEDDLPRYYNARASTKSSIVFNLHNIPQNPPQIIINEGVINSIIAGRDSVAVYGKYVSNNQISQICSKNPRSIIISLDRDALDLSYQLAKRINRYLPSCEIRIVILPNDTDASDLGRIQYYQYVERSQEYLPAGKYRLLSSIEKFLQ